nr:MAG TPA: hypothetical protein [Caudoviricetes sp.]
MLKNDFSYLVTVISLKIGFSERLCLVKPFSGSTGKSSQNMCPKLTKVSHG